MKWQVEKIRVKVGLNFKIKLFFLNSIYFNKGDSGGSIFVQDKVNTTQKYVAVGIVSYGVGCALPYYPGIYTRISYYLDWIQKYA